LFVVPFLFLVCGCGSAPIKTYDDDSELLPDLFIKQITYRSLGSAQRTRTRSSNLVISYEFKIQVANGGNADFGGTFFVGLTTALDDYDINLYSKHALLNETRQVIKPGQIRTFVVQADVEYPRPPIPAFLPMRFYINTEGFSTSSELATQKTREHDYRNNVYELSMRTIQRL
jgi:hypothetical protein